MEALPKFRLHRPDTLDEALATIKAEPDARFVGGGTDLIVNMRRGLVETPALIDLNNVAEMQNIAHDGDTLIIGSAVTLDVLAGDKTVVRDFPAIAQAAAEVAGPTHRNVATVGGNLCLDTRCIFYNQSGWWRESNDFCLKYRGEICHVAPKSKRCFAVFSGDLAPALLIHEATISVAGPGGERQLPLAELYSGDGADYLALHPGEIVTSVAVPKPNLQSAYRKARVRGSIDFPLAGVAVGLRMADGKIADLRAALTACDTKPFSVGGLDTFLGKSVDESIAQDFGEIVQQQARPMRTTMSTPWYRRRVVARLARRLLLELGAS
ncbi:MAG: 4-hydroxybenzoyl-CoA reductase subunit beta [Alphaproteobacteria bacterium]|nr:4-hydroxybenzoyl-CoA reductase subunit beta [Alphaproteobacteria bacterium]